MASDLHKSDTATTPAATRIAILEDDRILAGQMSTAFRYAGFEPLHVESGSALKSMLATEPIDLVTLDVGLPGENGIDVAREILARHSVPIVIVSGRDKPVERVVGLEIGADDYVTKPVDLDELVARVRAVLRRIRRGNACPVCGNSHGAAASGAVTFEGWRFDIAGHRLWAPSGELVDLTAAERDLLAVFAGSPRVALSRAEISHQLHGQSGGAQERSIDVNVGRLRRKLESHTNGLVLIKTLRGSGYLFCVEVQPLGTQ